MAAVATAAVAVVAAVVAAVTKIADTYIIIKQKTDSRVFTLEPVLFFNIKTELLELLLLRHPY